MGCKGKMYGILRKILLVAFNIFFNHSTLCIERREVAQRD